MNDYLYLKKLKISIKTSTNYNNYAACEFGGARSDHMHALNKDVVNFPNFENV